MYRFKSYNTVTVIVVKQSDIKKTRLYNQIKRQNNNDKKIMTNMT